MRLWQIRWTRTLGAQEPLVGTMLSLDEPSPAVLQTALADMFVRHWGGQRKGRGQPITAFQYLKGSYKKDEEQLFTRSDCDRRRRNAFKLKEGKR